ncbi:MAG TPA: hypothetical protein VES19_15650, partial [Candidatus Limnocylindrales bacterium]|nr:hypothetical protein [Candidatus Limnocylindrales bacterium]
DVSIPGSLGLDEDTDLVAGRFLVERVTQLGGSYAPYRVVATLDGEARRVDPQVTPIDATPPPSPSVAPAGERMSAADFERAVRLGKLGDRIVVVEGRMRLVIGRCRAGGSEDCSWLQLEGLPNVWISKGDLDVDEAGVAIRRHPNVAPIALRVSGYGVELIGWITAGASTPVDIAALLAGDLPLDPGEVVVVAGWVVGAQPDPPCAATPETCAMWPLLQAQAPRTDMEIGYGVASMATMVADSLGLRPAPAFRAGPFLVGARRAPAAFEPGIEVVAWFTDVVVVDPVPSESASPIPSSTPTPSRATPTYDPARSITNDELMTALGNGSLDGRLLLIEAELGTVAWPCPADVPEPCTRFFVDGLPGIALTYDGMVSGSDGSDGGAGVSGMTGTMVVVPRNGHLKLLGRLDEDLGSPVDFGPVFAGTADPIADGFEVTPVPGWLMREAVPGSCLTPAPTGEPGSTAAGCTPAVDVLSDGPPSEAAAIHYAINEDGGPGLEGSADVVEGPFLVRPGPFAGGPCPPESEGCSPIVSYGWQVLARYDPADIVQVNAP